MFLRHLIEARRNPEQNPKEDPMIELTKYAHDPQYYVHMSAFSEIKHEGQRTPGAPKIAINPTNPYDTPFGVYAYPLSAVWTHYQVDKKMTLKVLPFANTHPDIWIVRPAQGARILYADEYTEEKLKADAEKFKEIAGSRFTKKESATIPKSVYSYLYDKVVAKAKFGEGSHTIAASLASFLSQEGHPLTAMQIDRIHAALNLLLKGFHPAVAIPAVRRNKFLKQFAATVESQNNNTDSEVNDIINYAIENTKYDSPFGRFWNIGRVLAEKIDKTKKNRGRTIIWTNLMRAVGYDVIVNRKGEGIIHENEPYQAVFLTNRAFEVVKFLANRKPPFDVLDKLIERVFGEEGKPEDIDRLFSMIDQLVKVGTLKQEMAYGFLLQYSLNALGSNRQTNRVMQFAHQLVKRMVKAGVSEPYLNDNKSISITPSTGASYVHIKSKRQIPLLEACLKYKLVSGKFMRALVHERSSYRDTPADVQRRKELAKIIEGLIEKYAPEDAPKKKTGQKETITDRQEMFEYITDAPDGTKIMLKLKGYGYAYPSIIHNCPTNESRYLIHDGTGLTGGSCQHRSDYGKYSWNVSEAGDLDHIESIETEGSETPAQKVIEGKKEMLNYIKDARRARRLCSKAPRVKNLMR